MLDATMMAAHLAEMTADLPSTMVWTPNADSSQSVKTAQTVTAGITKGELELTYEMDEVGTFSNKDILAVGTPSKFTGGITPTVGELVTLDGEALRVLSKENSQDEDGSGYPISVTWIFRRV